MAFDYEAFYAARGVAVLVFFTWWWARWYFQRVDRQLQTLVGVQKVASLPKARIVRK